MAEGRIVNKERERLGFFQDGLDGELGPVAGSLAIRQDGRIEVRIPFLRPDPGAPATDLNQLRREIAGWDADPINTVPKCLLFLGSEGWVTLTGVRWAGSGRRHTGELRMWASAAFMGKPKQVQDSYLVGEMETEIDGLHQFAGLKVLQWEPNISGENPSVVPVARRSVESFKWSACGFDFEIKPHTESYVRDGHIASVNESTRLVTRKIEGATVHEHLRAQRAVRALLVLSFGRDVHWTEHWVRSDLFALTGLEERLGRALPTVSVVLEAAGYEGGEESSDWEHVTFPVVLLRQLTPDLMQKWTRWYMRKPKFRAAVDPAVEVIAAKGGFVEMRIMVLSAALNFFAYTGRKGREVPLGKQLAWALDQVGVDWPEIATNAEIGSRLAKVNNSLKHPDNKSVPSNDFLYATLEVLEVLARGQLVWVLELSEEIRGWFLQSPAMISARNALEAAWRS